MQHAAPLDQTANVGFVRELLVQRRRVLQEIAQGARRVLHPGFGPAREQIADQPGQGLGQIRPAHRERPQRVHQIGGDFLPGAWFGRRNHRMRRQPAGVAIACRLRAAGLTGIDQRDAITVTQRLDRADYADRAGADDGNMAACRSSHQRAFSCGDKILADRDRATGAG